MGPQMFFYFVAFILLASICLMNLITAVILESSLQQATSDRELKKRREDERRVELVSMLHNLFQQLDQDGSGMLDFEEMQSAPAEVHEVLLDIAGTSNAGDLKVIFDVLDHDNSGSISIAEFCEGLLLMEQGQRRQRGLEIM